MGVLTSIIWQNTVHWCPLLTGKLKPLSVTRDEYEPKLQNYAISSSPEATCGNPVEGIINLTSSTAAEALLAASNERSRAESETERDFPNRKVLIKKKTQHHREVNFMKKMGKVVIIDKPKGTFTVKSYPLPTPEPGTLLMKVEMCGVCGSDVHYWRGHKATFQVPFPGVFGHEIAGEILALGEGVTEDIAGHPVRVGDRIVPVPLITCGNCFFCTVANEPVKCLNAKAYGHLGDGSPFFTGGYAEYLYVYLPNSLFVRTGLSPERSVLLEPVSIGINCVEKIGVNVGETAVVQGSGPIGLVTLACVKAAGASKIIMVGGERDRLELATEFGADMTININETTDPKDRVETIKRETLGGHGADVVFECAGVPQAAPEGIDYLRYGGRYCEAGHFSDAGTVMINPSTHICAKRATIVGAWSSTPDQFIKALAVLREERFPFEKLITHRLPLERLEEAFNALASNYTIDGREVVKAVVAP